MWQIFSRKRRKWSYFFSTLFVRFFLAQNRKIFEVGEIRKYDEEREYFEKRFHFFERQVYQNRKAENMPVVVGGLVV